MPPWSVEPRRSCSRSAGRLARRFHFRCMESEARSTSLPGTLRRARCSSSKSNRSSPRSRRRCAYTMRSCGLHRGSPPNGSAGTPRLRLAFWCSRTSRPRDDELRATVPCSTVPTRFGGTQFAPGSSRQRRCQGPPLPVVSCSCHLRTGRVVGTVLSLASGSEGGYRQQPEHECEPLPGPGRRGSHLTRARCVPDARIGDCGSYHACGA